MKSIQNIRLFVIIFLSLSFYTHFAQPAVLGCNCTNACGINPTGGYEFTNLLNCPVDIRYNLVDANLVACAGNVITVPVGGVVCLFTCTDFAACTASPWNVIITLININGFPVAGSNTIDHTSTSTTGTQASPDPCTPTYNLSNAAGGGCGAQVN